MPLTDEDAALQAIATLHTMCEDQQEAKSKIDSILISDDPFVDVHALFSLYDRLYFRGLLLPRVEVSWSPRLTLCAGICELVQDPNNGNKYTRIRLKLSEPLLKYRPKSDVIDTLLHEAIHAYFFITTSWRHSRGDDGTGHGAGFLLLADAINNHGGYGISVYHTFHDEVDAYRTHIWQCDGPCRLQAPFFGLVKRAMNRPPGKGDVWWRKHAEDCGGTYVKVSEPELSRKQIEKLSGLDRAGRQKSKIDRWIQRPHGDGENEESDTAGSKRTVSPESRDSKSAKRPKTTVQCPICDQDLAESMINEHLDSMHGG